MKKSVVVPKQLLKISLMKMLKMLTRSRILLLVLVMEVTRRLGLLMMTAPAHLRGGVMAASHWRSVSLAIWRPDSAEVSVEVTRGWRMSSKPETRTERTRFFVSEASWRTVSWTGVKTRSKMTLDPL